MNIYMNGEQTAYKNIFDLLEAKNIAQWYNASDALIGRKLEQVLNDWGKTNKTYYYINGTRYDFELK